MLVADAMGTESLGQTRRPTTRLGVRDRTIDTRVPRQNAVAFMLDHGHSRDQIDMFGLECRDLCLVQRQGATSNAVILILSCASSPV